MSYDNLPPPPSPPFLQEKNELGDRLLNFLGVEHKFVNKKVQEDAALEAIKEEYNFDEITDAFDESAVPHQLDFFYGGADQIFFRSVSFYHQTEKIQNLLLFCYLKEDRV